MTDRSPRRRIGLVLGLVAVTAGVAAAGDSPKSRGARPIFISPSGQDVEAFSLAGNARGDLAVVWGTYVRGHHRLWFRDRPAGGSFRRVHELPAGHAHLGGYYSVALARDGTEFVIWSQINNRRSRGNGIRVAVRHPGGTFGSRHRLTRQFGADVDLAVSADGTAIATWTRWAGRSSQIVAAVRAPDGKWSPPQVV